MTSKTESKSVPIKRAKGKEESGGRLMQPFDEIDQLFDRFMERVYPRGWWLGPRWELPELPHPFAGKRPNVDVIDRDDEIVVRAELPGVDKKDLEVSMSENTLTIKATSSYEKEEKKEDYFRSEIAHGSFSRTIALPCEVDEARTSAKFSNGVLELAMPKLAKAKRHKITVK
jgi:HSP20 family protein